MTRLFTIGDSISQGFMSGAAARTELSYSTLLAKKLGLLPGGYAYPTVWKQGGLPTNIESVLRVLNRRYGSNIRGIEWLTALSTINSVLDMAEAYYERGEGNETVGLPDVRSYHNVAARGFDVADAWKMTPSVALQNIRKENSKTGTDDFIFGVPNASFYRTAHKVLNPSLSAQFDDFSQLSWLEHHVTESGGVENLCLWLGANNALGTVVDLEIRQTPGDGSPVGMSHDARVHEKWNLWHPNDFKAEYKLLLDKVDAAMNQNADPNWNVFIGTVPYVSIAPLLKGVGSTVEIDGDLYFKYYTYFPFTEEIAHKEDLHLTINQVLHIDNCIRAYNEFIKSEVDRLNTAQGRKCYHIVDIAKALHQMAWKRNSGKPTYPFPAYFEFVYPRIDTKYYHVSANGTMKQGGIFSLDGVHPTAIGQGLIAHEFGKVMQGAGVAVPAFTDADWAEIFATDTLYTSPITLMGELYEHERLAAFILQASRVFKS
ncbi:MAG: hypothetical protein H7Z72_04410 [Bacteroidetes bacterium]|nr:hypothetical protein [Fibrella sp.]